MRLPRTAFRVLGRRVVRHSGSLALSVDGGATKKPQAAHMCCLRLKFGVCFTAYVLQAVTHVVLLGVGFEAGEEGVFFLGLNDDRGFDQHQQGSFVLDLRPVGEQPIDDWEFG